MSRSRPIRSSSLPISACAVLLLLALPGRAPAQQSLQSQPTLPTQQTLFLADEVEDEDAGSRTAAATTNDAGPVGIIPLTHGFNASVGTTSQHDSSNGWTSLLTPGAAFRFNPFFSLSTGIPVYTYINVLQTKGTAAKPVYVPTTLHGAVGDMNLAANAEAHFFLDYNATASLGLPTGNTAYGLGAGQVVYALNNHFERSVGIVSPDIELGIGDTSSLTNTRVRKAYTAVGTLAHFQAGASVDLPHNLGFSADAYEELPLAASTIYSTTGRGKKKVTTAMGKSVAEDNGFLTSLDIPVAPHVTFSGFYTRSLRAHDDVAGFSFTFLLKAPPRETSPQQ